MGQEIMNELLEWELSWIDKNIDRYESIKHSNLVKHNIMKRYLTREIKNKLKEIAVNAMKEAHVDLSRGEYTGEAMAIFLDEIAV